MNLLYLLMALAGGAGLSIQAALNSRLSAGLGGQPLVASFFSFAIGALCLGAVALVQADWHNVAANIGQQPWWRWLGGAIGAAFVFTTVYLAPKIGITSAMFLFIIGQLTAGMFIDGFGLLQMAQRPVYWWKLAGLGVMLVGLVCFMFGDKVFLHE
ncbi:DMT family transporter [Pusillimonas sp. CC-YST705]|uniref:DMT family transporter n=1 Tax=Mesopusillimonas faecipullorum TaxID=2755040 RepID=A0ABS8CC20_9BURK|nr:DMT family transporter [Mesopusillimonas faecipullorum]MCB5363581.1 DMT family transporter [Mesopusillimonas faecipullorum]